MTSYTELIEELGEALFVADVGDYTAKKLYYAKDHYESMAAVAVDIIFKTLQEKPTQEMEKAFTDKYNASWDTMASNETDAVFDSFQEALKVSALCNNDNQKI